MVMKVRLADLNATTSCHALLCDESIKRHQPVRRTTRTAFDFLRCLRLRNHAVAVVSASWALKSTAATFRVNSCKESQFRNQRTNFTQASRQFAQLDVAHGLGGLCHEVALKFVPFASGSQG